VFGHKPYLSLEDPDVRRMALDDPRAFLDRFPDGGILDEIQRAPELLSYLQTDQYVSYFVGHQNNYRICFFLQHYGFPLKQG